MAMSSRRASRTGTGSVVLRRDRNASWFCRIRRACRSVIVLLAQRLPLHGIEDAAAERSAQLILQLWRSIGVEPPVEGDLEEAGLLLVHLDAERHWVLLSGVQRRSAAFRGCL